MPGSGSSPTIVGFASAPAKPMRTTLSCNEPPVVIVGLPLALANERVASTHGKKSRFERLSARLKVCMVWTLAADSMATQVLRK